MYLSKPTVVAIWAIGVPLVHGAAPWGIARLTDHHGWLGAPGWPNLVGLVPIAVGAAALVWSVVLHVRHAPPRSAVEWSPSYLIERGPYAVSRNPMYVAELVLWIGWVVLSGSAAVAIALAVLWTGIAVAARWEERMLAARFGTGYVAYRDRVPRWLGRPRTPDLR